MPWLFIFVVLGVVGAAAAASSPGDDDTIDLVEEYRGFEIAATAEPGGWGWEISRDGELLEAGGGWLPTPMIAKANARDVVDDYVEGDGR